MISPARYEVIMFERAASDVKIFPPRAEPHAGHAVRRNDRRLTGPERLFERPNNVARR